MPFPERLIEITTGTFVVALAAIWLRQRRRHLRWVRAMLAVWWLLWLGVAGTSYVCLLEAQGALTGASVAPDERQVAFARWLDLGMQLRLASLLVLVLGLAAIAVVWARTQPKSDGD